MPVMAGRETLSQTSCFAGYMQRTHHTAGDGGAYPSEGGHGCGGEEGGETEVAGEDEEAKRPGRVVLIRASGEIGHAPKSPHLPQSAHGFASHDSSPYHPSHDRLHNFTLVRCDRPGRKLVVIYTSLCLCTAASLKFCALQLPDLSCSCNSYSLPQTANTGFSMRHQTSLTI